MSFPDLTGDGGALLRGVVAVNHDSKSRAQRQIGIRAFKDTLSIGHSAGRHDEVFVRDAHGKAVAEYQGEDVWAAWLEHPYGSRALTFTLVPWTHQSVSKSGPFTLRCNGAREENGLLIWSHEDRAGGWARLNKLANWSLS